MNLLLKISSMFMAAAISQQTLALPDDTRQPLDIQADEASFDQQTGEAIYTGNVFITQGSIQIEADYLKINTDLATQQFNKLEAKGKPAKFSQQIDLEGNMVISQGNQIHYSTTLGRLEITGDGYLNQTDNKVSADYILYMVNTGAFEASKKGTGRVTMTLQPQTEE
ncbi:lipopolysaccharide transport periplasmic protein LptA [Marinomonas dokdonensis]|uniref:lipopolysaccharide transport periplasmic protein LptA n=1 Tax=Marinomonas dokdonensis TaxID=328224 RepID=UPI0040558DAE